MLKYVNGFHNSQMFVLIIRLRVCYVMKVLRVGMEVSKKIIYYRRYNKVLMDYMVWEVDQTKTYYKMNNNLVVLKNKIEIIEIFFRKIIFIKKITMIIYHFDFVMYLSEDLNEKLKKVKKKNNMK